MGFDLSSGIDSLESYLETRSYIEGHEPSQADVAVYKELKSAPSADSNPHVSLLLAISCFVIALNGLTCHSSLPDGTSTSLHTPTITQACLVMLANLPPHTVQRRPQHQLRAKMRLLE